MKFYLSNGKGEIFIKINKIVAVRNIKFYFAGIA